VGGGGVVGFLGFGWFCCWGRFWVFLGERGEGGGIGFFVCLGLLGGRGIWGGGAVFFGRFVGRGSLLKKSVGLITLGHWKGGINFLILEKVTYRKN